MLWIKQQVSERNIVENRGPICKIIKGEKGDYFLNLYTQNLLY